MRWVFAGLSFAVLIGLAVATVAIRSANIAVRARLEVVARNYAIESVELGRRKVAAREVDSPEDLAACWRACLRVSTAE